MNKKSVLHKGSNKTIILNSSVLYIRLGLVLFLSLFSTRYVLEGLGESNFGIYNLIAGIVALFGFISATMSSITQRFLSFEIGATQDIDHVRYVFNTSLRLHIFIAFLVTIIVIIGGTLLVQFVLNIPTANHSQALVVLICTSISVFITIIGVPFESVLMAHENIVFVASVQIGSSILKFLSAITLIYILNNQLIVYAALIMSITFITVTCQVLYTKKKYQETSFISISLKENKVRKEMQTFAGFTLWGNMGWAIRNQGIAIWLNILFGVLVNAANGIANQVNGALMSLSSSLTMSIRPQLVQSAGEQNFERMIKLAFSACKYPLLVIAMIGIPIAIEIPLVLKYWLGEVPNFTVVFCRILILELLLNQSTFGIALILDATNHIKQLHIGVGLSLIITTVIAYFVGKILQSPIAIYWCLVFNTAIISIIRYRLCIEKVSNLGFGDIFRKELVNNIIYPIGFIFILTVALFLVSNMLPQNILGILLLISVSILLVVISSFFFFIEKDFKIKIVRKIRL